MSNLKERIFFANLVTGKAGTTGKRLIDAFAAVSREDFFEPGPWQIFTFANGYIESPSDNPAYLYQDVLIALAPDRKINNGEPSLHARCLAALALTRIMHQA